MKFNHEKLIVYQQALNFIEFTSKLFTENSINLNVYLQLDKDSTAIPLNIAEGTGRFTNKDKSHYYDIARGSALESSACLDVLVKKKIITEETADEGKKILIEIVSMLIALIKSISDRVYEDETAYDY
ncbi:MAG TPA: four helix bundle protein [Ignavibacteriaceae bacterium]|nr:four helix bundle protein [Ignavibacteriaceae bacterium]